MKGTLLNKDLRDADAVSKDALETLPDQSIDAWDVLESLIGQVEGPADWSEQHDHYLYGTPKNNVSHGILFRYWLCNSFAQP